MKTFALVFCLIFLGVAVATAEDLGALAKKEKERREALAKEGKKGKTYTNADIQNLKANLAIESTTPETEKTSETTSSETRGKRAGQERPSTEAKPTEAKPAEQETNTLTESETDQQLKELRQQKEELDQQAQESRENIGTGGNTGLDYNLGSKYQKTREAEEEVEKVDQKIKELEEQKAKENEQ